MQESVAVDAISWQAVFLENTNDYNALRMHYALNSCCRVKFLDFVVRS